MISISLILRNIDLHFLQPISKSYLWSQMTDSGNPIRCFTYTPARGAHLAYKLFTGVHKGAVLMTDGYEPYNA
ncbi:hypothetical protein AXG89_31685 (plasmid) [Burkholderia sp. PAMC 26561]|nr:hypothetical protein AXG89_31685 [Burkholderia sp. PAMC 26561]